MSISELVQKVTDQLSEGVSKFTLFVVLKKEQNAPIPPSLAGSVNQVGSQCSNLVALARQFSEAFEEYGAIKADILGGAAGLDSSGRNLVSTCNSMVDGSAEDLANSWQCLANACGSIAEHVINLLQVLYKAEINRIYASAEKAKNFIQQSQGFNAAQIDADPQRFADKASEAASELNQMATYLQERAESEESPLMRQQLMEHANIIRAQGEELISAANLCLEDPTQTAKHLAAYQSASKSSAAKVDAVVKTLKDSQSYRETSASLAPKSAGGEASGSKSPGPAAGRGRGGAGAGAGAGRGGGSAGGAGPSSGGGTIGEDWRPSTMLQVAQAVQSYADQSGDREGLGGPADLSREIRRLAEAAKSGQASEVLAASRAIANLSANFATKARETAGTTRHLQTQDKLFQNAAGMRDLCQQLKILASVKAGVAKANLDRDEQLISLTSNLVKLWKETGDNMEIAKLRK